MMLISYVDNVDNFLLFVENSFKNRLKSYISLSIERIKVKMLGSKAPNNDANGLFRATHSHNPTRYSHIMVLTPHFYAHIGAGLKVILPPVCKHTWFQTF